MRTTLALALVVAALSAAAPARVHSQARSKTANLQVTAEIPANCTLTPHDLNFGPYDPVVANKTTPLSGQTTIDLMCTVGTVGRVDLDYGQHGRVFERAMTDSTGARLVYSLFRNPGATDPFRSNAQGAPFTTRADGRYVMFVYGRVAASQNVAAGNYSDTVLATVYY